VIGVQAGSDAGGIASGGGIVDSHTHLLPDRLARAIRAFFERHLPAGTAYPLDHRQILDRHAADGIGAVWALPYAHKPGMADQLNRSMVDLAAALADHPVEVVPGCTAHPGDPQPGRVVVRAVEAGARVCKLHCSVGDYAADDARLDPVWAAAAEAGIPVVVHAGHAVSGHTHQPELDPIATVAARHPDTTIVLAHSGHPAVGRALSLLDRFPNLFADLTPVVVEPVAVGWAEVVARADRFLFGTDVPNTGIAASVLLERVEGWSLPAGARAAVLGGNARRLVPLPAR
jgi:predicted TIM-barrel fold metal-dependent hydrolase